jgi:hypothetical protein
MSSECNNAKLRSRTLAAAAFSALHTAGIQPTGLSTPWKDRSDRRAGVLWRFVVVIFSYNCTNYFELRSRCSHAGAHQIRTRRRCR